jgi:hypothetical protein
MIKPYPITKFIYSFVIEKYFILLEILLLLILFWDLMFGGKLIVKICGNYVIVLLICGVLDLVLVYSGMVVWDLVVRLVLLLGIIIVNIYTTLISRLVCMVMVIHRILMVLA